MNCGIYSILNKFDGKIYVGQSVNIHKRFIRHKSALKCNYHPNIHLQNSWNKYGKDSFEFNILELCDEEKLDDNEIWWINYFDSTNLRNGYNIQSGGESTHRLAKETREKISESLKGRIIKESSRKKISESHCGKVRHIDECKSISEATSSTRYFRVYKCKGKQYLQGFTWRYRYYEDGVRKSLSNTDIGKLKERVLDKGLEWIEFE